MKKVLIVLMMLLTLFSVCCACGKGEPKDPNAALTDSDVPLDLGAEMDSPQYDASGSEFYYQ